MNLQTDVSEIRARISEQYADDEADLNFTENEIVRWLNSAEMQILLDLDPSVLEDSGVTSTANTNLASPDQSKPVPTDMLKITSVALNGYSAGQTVKQAQMVPYDTLLLSSSDSTWRASDLYPLAAIHAGSVHFRPAASASVTAGLQVQYVKVPTPRYKRYRGKVTGYTSNLVFADVKAVAAGYPDDYFNSGELLFTRGTARGQSLVVSDYTGATGTFTFATGFHLVTVGDEFEVGDVSLIPDRFRNPVIQYVTYLALLKDREDLAQLHLSEYVRQVARFNGRDVEAPSR